MLRNVLEIIIIIIISCLMPYSVPYEGKFIYNRKNPKENPYSGPGA